MSQNAKLGTNRTGAARAPRRLQEMLSGVEEFPPSSAGSAQAIADVRIAYAQDGEAAGSVPPPPGVGKKIQTAMKAVVGDNPTLFTDKLGERLAFERSGVRLYEALVSKHDAFGSFSGGPSRDDLTHICEEEYEHFGMLQQAIEQLGGDPTAVTPSANIQATASLGINMLLDDPRITLLQSLEGILVAELTDNDCWRTLMALARDAGEDQLADQFQQAFLTEQEHLAKVRTWIAAGQRRSLSAAQAAALASEGA